MAGGVSRRAGGGGVSHNTGGGGGQPGHHGRERGGRWADFSSPFEIADARAGGKETVAARGALALRILALAMPNARAIRIVNSSTWEKNGRGRGGKSLAVLFVLLVVVARWRGALPNGIVVT